MFIVQILGVSDSFLYKYDCIDHSGMGHPATFFLKQNSFVKLIARYIFLNTIRRLSFDVYVHCSDTNYDTHSSLRFLLSL